MTGVNDLREAFLSFFETHNHVRSPSAPLVPDNDPTLLFVNAGMVPFKNIFTGLETPHSRRAASSQKCVRAGGKHSDLDNVGYTARHHTFFELLGNFSFGDYFIEVAIAFAWEFISKDLALPPEKLLVTVYADDEEAAALWRKISGFADDKIIPIATSDNFWSMGDIGPCGPCSEIFYDHGADIPGGPPGSPDEDGDRFVEIWNLVFMQFDQTANGARTHLPRPSIDTGMGLERIAAVLQGVHNNYDIDLFRALIAAAEEVYATHASGDALASFRVIADHLRASAFLMADGVTPSNEGRGYVLRRIMRRAMRHGHMLGAREPVMHRLVDALASEMGAAYPDLIRARPAIESALEQEEARFQKTLGRGLALLDEAAAPLGEAGMLPGETAFKLYDTYGFPLDLTQDILRARGLEVDEAGFETAMARQKAGSREAWQGSGDAGSDEIWFDIAGAVGPTRFTGYDAPGVRGESLIAAIVQDGRRVEEAGDGAIELVFEATPFYAESGGQAGDRGEIRFASGARVLVRDVQKRAGAVFVHIGEVIEGSIQVGDMAELHVDAGRRTRIRANHSATHLLHAALRDVLGPHVAQRGSLVEEDRLRFDFSHAQPVSPAEIEAIEDQVNAVIRQNTAVDTQMMAPDKAIEAGALALFGEKYGDEVRVLTMGRGLADADTPYSVELCGGTHVARTGDIGLLSIVSESGVSAGVRRIEAATGAEALAFLKGRGQIAVDLAERLKTPLKDLPQRVAGLVEERRNLERALADAKKTIALGGAGGGGPAAPEDIGGVKLIARIAEGVGGKDLRGLVDAAKADLGSGVAMFVGVADGKAAISIGVTDDLVERFSAVDLVRVASAAVGGKGGGGRPDMAQAGGPDGDKAEAALEAVRASLRA